MTHENAPDGFARTLNLAGKPRASSMARPDLLHGPGRRDFGARASSGGALLGAMVAAIFAAAQAAEIKVPTSPSFSLRARWAPWSTGVEAVDPDGNPLRLAVVFRCRLCSDRRQRGARLAARGASRAAWLDRAVGLVSGRGDRDGADGRGLWRRHPPRRAHAISARRLRRDNGFDRRGNLGAWRRPGRTDRMVSASRPKSVCRDAAAGLRRCADRAETAHSRWLAAFAAGARRLAQWRGYYHDPTTAMAARHELRHRRLEHRPAFHPAHSRLRGAACCRASFCPSLR